MSFPRNLVFVEQPTALPWTPDRWRAAGFQGFAVLTQDGAERVRVEEGVAFRDRARAAGFYVGQWVNLETGTGFDLVRAGELANSVAPHFDGTVVDAEIRTSPDACGPFLNAFPYRGPLALSTVPTFPFGAGAASWDRRQAWLLQQTYWLENKWSPAMARVWAITAPPLYVGWYYRATIRGLGRRVRLETPTQVSSIDGPFTLNTTTRALLTTAAPGKSVGGLLGLWNPARWAPTLRTTPMNGATVPAGELRASVKAAGSPAAGIYLGETTQDDFWSGYRP